MVRLLTARRGLWVVSLIAAVLVLNPGLCRSGGAASDDARVNITYNAPSGKPIPVTLPRGAAFTITLDSNPTTGYSWKLGGALNSKILKSEGGKYISPAQTDPPMVGKGGQEVWTFKAVGPGKQTVTLMYVRPWEKNVPPVRTQKIVVTVQ